MKKTIITLGVVIASFAGILFLSYHDTKPAEEALGSTLPFGGQTFNLAGSGVSSSATSITLQSLTVTQTGQPIVDSDLSDTFYITLEPGNRTKQEIVGCTTVTQNAGGTATLSGCSRGLSPITPYTASTTLQFVHAGGSQVIFSNPPQHYNLYTAKANNESIAGTWSFTSTAIPGLDTFASSTNNQFTTWKFVNDGFVNATTTQTVAGAKTFTATSTFNLGILGAAAYDCVTSSASTQYCQKGYIDSTNNTGASNANYTQQGLVEQATVAEINAGTLDGGTGARLFVNPNDLKYTTYASSTLNYSTTTSVQLATTTITSDLIPNKDHLQVAYFASTTADQVLLMTFNNDTSSIYSSRRLNNVTAAGEANAPAISITNGSGAANNQVLINIDIINVSGIYKYGKWTALTLDPAAGTTNSIVTGAFFYKSTSAITQIDIGIVGSPAGARISTSTNIIITGY